MTNILKKAVAGLLDQILSPSKVIDVRAWHPATIYEVDIHFPKAAMDKWSTIKRLKCKVGELQYKDYTPALWNAERKLCTMYIEAGHNGAGSHWVRKLKPGDEILLSEAHAAQLPAAEGKILCLGDGTAIGHFLALKQLTGRNQYPMEVGIFLHENYRIPIPLININPEFTFITKPGEDGLDLLTQWCKSKTLSSYSSIYLAGNIPMVKALRTMLKATTNTTGRIYAHGFWS